MNISNESGTSLEFSVNRPEPKMAVLNLVGDLDVSTVSTIIASARRLSEEGVTRQVYELSGLGHLDSSGIGFFLGAQNDLGSSGGGIAIAGAGDYLLGIFSLVHLDSMIPVCLTVEDAIEKLRGSGKDSSSGQEEI